MTPPRRASRVIVAGAPEDGGAAGYKLCADCRRLTFLPDLATLCLQCRPGPLPAGIAKTREQE